MLLRSCKPIVLAVNKCDRIGDPPPEFYEFYNLGLGDPIAISSVHGHGSCDLLDEVLKYLPDEPAEERDEDDYIKVAVIGKPNAGKSSLLNYMAGDEIAIVTDVAGTTRDTIS
jgi:GTP-binding protein